jgi:hypothetical protein
MNPQEAQPRSTDIPGSDDGPPRWISTALDVTEGQPASSLGPAAFRERLRDRPVPRDIAFDANGDDLAGVGWGVVLAEGEDPEIQRALEPLVALRRQQAGKLFRQVTYHGETPARFRRDLGIAPGPVDPSRFPYHVLLVGGPERLPFELQFDLHRQHSVGRLDLGDPAAFARYAENAVQAETLAQRPPGLSIFAAGHPGDDITRSCIDNLAAPLAREFASRAGASPTTVLGAEATRERLQRLLGEAAGSLLLTISHGVLMPPGHPRQRHDQGSLVCADWPGPGRWQGALPPGFLFGAADLPPAADLTGSMVFLYGCYTLGTPQRSLFERPASAPLLTPVPFVGALARSLLAHPGGGALAVVGHIDQSYETTWVWPGAGSRTETFASALLALRSGSRLGHALAVFARRHAEISSELAHRLWQMPEGEMSPAERDDLAKLWQSFHDSSAFGVLGDPAVRLTPTGGR